MTDAIIVPNVTVGEFEDNLYEPPKISDPGRILFQFDPQEPNTVEILDYDGDKAPFWLNESGFMDYYVRDMVNIELEGTYVLEGVTGYGWKDYFGEYDENWSFTHMRRASESEIKTGALD